MYYIFIKFWNKEANTKVHLVYDQSSQQKFAAEAQVLFPSTTASSADETLKIRKGYKVYISRIQNCILNILNNKEKKVGSDFHHDSFWLLQHAANSKVLNQTEKKHNTALHLSYRPKNFIQKIFKHLSVMLHFNRTHQKNLISPSLQPKVPFDEVHRADLHKAYVMVDNQALG